MATLTYRDAGVDIDRGDRFVDFVKTLDRVDDPRAIGGIGGFSGLFLPDLSSMREPVLTAATDGVGTKLAVAIAAGRHDTVGIDLVAMCVNDLVVVGAEPLFFLDYYATGRLDDAVAREVLTGIAEGCRQGRLALLGGETAEMPGFYGAGDYDLAGFAVGVVDRAAIIDGSLVAPGDVVIGLASSGLHSNGYSLVRKALLEHRGMDLHGPSGCSSRTLAEELLEPTRIYVDAIARAKEAAPLHAMAHVTGGGIAGNLVRVLPEGTRAIIDRSAIVKPPVYDLLEELVDEEERYRTFNMGLGFVVIVAEESRDDVLTALRAAGERAWIVGHVTAGDKEVILD